jgi:hypothetical protein
MGAKAIVDTLTVKYQKQPHTNPRKVLRLPEEGTIKSLWESMRKGPGSEIKTNSQLLAWCSGRMCTTKAEFDALTGEDDNKVLVLATFYREVEVDIESPIPQLVVDVDVEARHKRGAIWCDAKIIANKGDGNFEVQYSDDESKEVLHPKFIRAKVPPATKEKKTTLGLVMSSWRMLLVLKAFCEAGRRIATQSAEPTAFIWTGGQRSTPAHTTSTSMTRSDDSSTLSMRSCTCSAAPNASLRTSCCS